MCTVDGKKWHDRVEPNAAKFVHFSAGDDPNDKFAYMRPSNDSSSNVFEIPDLRKYRWCDKGASEKSCLDTALTTRNYDKNIPHDSSYNMNDAISWMKVPPGVIVDVWKDAQYEGDHYKYTSSNDGDIGQWPDNDITSMKIRWEHDWDPVNCCLNKPEHHDACRDKWCWKYTTGGDTEEDCYKIISEEYCNDVKNLSDSECKEFVDQYAKDNTALLSTGIQYCKDNMTSEWCKNFFASHSADSNVRQALHDYCINTTNTLSPFCQNVAEQLKGNTDLDAQIIKLCNEDANKKLIFCECISKPLFGNADEAVDKPQMKACYSTACNSGQSYVPQSYLDNKKAGGCPNICHIVAEIEDQGGDLGNLTMNQKCNGSGDTGSSPATSSSALWIGLGIGAAILIMLALVGVIFAFR